ASLARALGVICCACCFFLVRASGFAQTPENIAEREVARRQAAIPQGEAALARGKAAMKAKDYALAHEEFRKAVAYLPDALVSGKAHDEAVEGFCKSGVVLAQARIAEGRYADAEAILSEILSERYDPHCRQAQELYARLRQPGFFNKTMSPQFIEKVEQVKQLLAEADGFYQSGRYDLAMKRYDQVLAIDPYNTAARKGQERVNNTKYRYGEQAYNETRSRQLWQVEKAWEQPVRRYGATEAASTIGAQRDLGGTAQVNRKLNSIIIPHVEFRDATIREAIDVLREQAAENDPEGRGVNIVLPLRATGSRNAVTAASPSVSSAPTGPAAGTTPDTTSPAGSRVAGSAMNVLPDGPRVTLELNQIPLYDALHYLAEQAGLKLRVDSHAVALVPAEQSEELVTKRYQVPPEFFGGPLDVGMYLSERVSASGSIQQAAGAGGMTQPLVAERVIDKIKQGYTAATQ